MTTQPETQPAAKTGRGAEIAKLILAVALLAIAGYLIATRYSSAATDWYLGNLRRDPVDREAWQGLRDLGVRALPRIVQDLDSPDPDTRIVAVIALSAIDGPGAEAALARASGDDDIMTASNAVNACALRRDAATAGAIDAALRGARRQVRLAARRAAERRFGVPWWAYGTVVAANPAVTGG